MIQPIAVRVPSAENVYFAELKNVMQEIVHL